MLSTELIKIFILNTCGTIKKLIRDCGPQPELCVGSDLDLELVTLRERRKNRIQVLTGTLNLNLIEKIQIDCDPDIFLETLLNNLKNDVISHQAFIRKSKKAKLTQLSEKLYNIKKNLNPDPVSLREAELAYNSLLDSEMRSELENTRHYEILHNEKMTPRFLTLSKIKKSSNLDIVRRADGTEFSTAAERDSHIRDFYKKSTPKSQVLLILPIP
jgi:hypothetical protein